MRSPNHQHGSSFRSSASQRVAAAESGHLPLTIKNGSASFGRDLRVAENTCFIYLAARNFSGTGHLRPTSGGKVITRHSRKQPPACTRHGKSAARHNQRLQKSEKQKRGCLFRLRDSHIVLRSIPAGHSARLYCVSFGMRYFPFARSIRACSNSFARSSSCRRLALRFFPARFT